MASEVTRQEIARIVDWYRAMGVDAVVDEVCLDWRDRDGPGIAFRKAFQNESVMPGAGTGRQEPAGVARPGARTDAPSPQARAPAAAPEPARPRPAVVMAPAVRTQAATPSAAAAEAATLARRARSLPELEDAIATFDGCGLKRTASRACFFRGAETARLMIVGEAPGREEDLAGKPFVGPAGQLLDKMLRSAGIEPDATHITNMVYWRPPGNRTPTPEEVDVCLPFLTRQIEFVGPEFVLVLGAAAAKGLLGIEEGITRARGVWRELSMAGRTMRAMATLHPAYLLRTPAAKRHAWRDVLVVKNALKSV